MHSTRSKLAHFMLTNTASILRRWQVTAKTAIADAKPSDASEFQEQGGQLLDVIAQRVLLASTEPLTAARNVPTRQREVASAHARSRLLAGMTIDQMVVELQALRSAVLRLYAEHTESLDAYVLEELTCFNETFDQAVADAVAHYAKVANEARSLFLGALAHDLRTPLGAISMTAQVLGHVHIMDNEQLKRLSARIGNCVQRATQIVGNVLDLTRIHVGSGIPLMLAEVDLGHICMEVIEELKTIYPERAIQVISSGDLSGTFDQGRLAQVFCNLIGNALQHGIKTAPIKVWLGKEAKHYVFTVQNLGEPIPPSEHPHLFNPLRRYAKQALAGDGPMSSMGLGLYISHQIVTAHGGAIGVESSPENGTTFTVRLPTDCDIHNKEPQWESSLR